MLAINFVTQGLHVLLVRNLVSYAASIADVQRSARNLVHLAQNHVDGHAYIVVYAICHARSPVTLSLAAFDVGKN
jgi:hypothetical protein